MFSEIKPKTWQRAVWYLNQVCELGMTDKETNNNQKAKQKKRKKSDGKKQEWKFLKSKSKNDELSSGKELSIWYRRKKLSWVIQGAKVEKFPLYGLFPLVLAQLC